MLFECMVYALLGRRSEIAQFSSPYVWSPVANAGRLCRLTRAELQSQSSPPRLSHGPDLYPLLIEQMIPGGRTEGHPT